MLDTSSLGQTVEPGVDTNGNTPPPTTARHYPTADELLTRCNTLISELEAFKEHLKARKLDHTIEIAHFRNTVKSEHKTLERLAKASQSEQSTQHTVNSSNLPFLETVWSTVKRTNGLQALQKRFYWHGGLSKGRAARQANAARGNGVNTRIPDKRKESALVDVVGQDGSEWIKVSLITNTRLLFDKAKQGWEEVSSSEDSDDEDDDGQSSKSTNQRKDEDDDRDIPLIRMVKELFKAAKTIRIRTNNPRIRLVLPKIEEGQIDAIDDIIATLRNLGCTVDTSEHVRTGLPLTDVIDNLTTDPFKDLTETLNIDCTILLALVSDFSHCSVEAEPWFHRALKRQVEIEDKENLLPNLLYPAIAGHTLICTKEAATRMHEIVDTIGTPGEKARTKLFMASSEQQKGDASTAESEGKLRDLLQEWSKFEVPPNLHLPIRVEDAGIQLTNHPTPAETADLDAEVVSDNNTDSAQEDSDPALLKLPPSAKHVKNNLTWINQSVFLHGWLTSRSTITSNRTVVKQIDHILDRHAQSEKEWPSIWLCPTARSLVGKEKGRKE